MKKSNPILRQTVVLLERQGRRKNAPVWRQASKSLAAGSSKGVEVNVGHISKCYAAGDAVLVPGKVLGSGNVDKKLVVGAYSFSSAARKKIAEAGGSAVGIRDLVEKYPDGSGVKIVD